MLTLRTLPVTLMLCASIITRAGEKKPPPKEGNSGSTAKAVNKTTVINYTLHIDNTINKNSTVDSVLVIFDKFDRSGAGIVKKVFYPDAENQIVIKDLPVGKYYADIYVLGIYNKHFSSIIKTVKSGGKNSAHLKLDYKDTYTPGKAYLPGENIKLFAYTN